jgi:hypothetical protein
MNNIRAYIDENQNLSKNEIYKNLLLEYDENDIKFIFLDIYDIDIESEIKDDKYEVKKKRDYQYQLRIESLSKYDNKCVISGKDKKLLLEVAHIKPVSECETNTEKMDVNNTLLLWIDLHKFFDAYLISINPDTCMVEVKDDYFMEYNGLKLNLNNETKKYLKYHYNIFISHNKIEN